MSRWMRVPGLAGAVETAVRNADGTPRVVYHGTPRAGITRFDRKASALRRAHSGQVGVWFTTSEEDARMFGPNVVRAHLFIRAPAQVDGWAGFEALWAVASALKSPRKGLEPGNVKPEALRAWLKARGHDGVRIVGGEDSVPGLDYWIALEPEQISILP